MRRGLLALMVVVLVSLTGAWRPAGALNVIFDDRADRVARPLGTAVVLGDSVGYGLVRALEGWGYQNMTARLAADGWGPVRSYTLAGLHAAQGNRAAAAAPNQTPRLRSFWQPFFFDARDPPPYI